ncbi:MAG: hypothetical protein KDC98_03145, partial [Planctomycetes bacterium]|nr:hypothetical protein [Planctomycetota bacterium]
MPTRAHVTAALLTASVLPPAAAQTDWHLLPLLAHHRHAACAWDTARSRLVLFGGASDVARVGDTWEWNGADWSRATPAHAPAARDASAMAYDPGRGVVVLFGGRTDAGEQADTWEWNGIDWSSPTPGTAPSPRRHHCMTWDGGRQRVLLFGGRGATCAELGDSVEWDGRSCSQNSPLHRPPGRTGAAMAWDSRRDRVVLFAGSCFVLGPCYRYDTWEWDGLDWSDVSLPFAASPPPRWCHAMVFDPHRDRVVVFGGSDEPGHYKSDTWEWDGMTWIERSTAHRPVTRLGHTMVHDPVSRRTFVVGGESFFGLVSDLWALDGNDWQLLHPGVQPNAGLYARFDAAWDGDHGGVMWFGMGIVEAPFRQTWLWADDRWTLINEDQGQPWPDQHRLQWLPIRHRMILHQPAVNGIAERTWEYDGAGWNQLTTVHLPGAGNAFAMTLDPRLDRITLFGGRTGNGTGDAATWQFDGGDWRQATPATSPPGRYGHAMTLDLPRRRIVLFGGRNGGGLLGDTWEWDGVVWRQRAPSNAPSPRDGHRMTFDCGRRRTVLHGGHDGSRRADTWEWNGEDWTLRLVTTEPPPSYEQLLAYDVATAATIHIGTLGNRTWSYGPTRPAEFVPFDNGCGGSLGAPVMLPEFAQRPYVGEDYHLALQRLPGPFAFCLSGFSNTSWLGVPLPYDLGSRGFPG